MLEIIFFKGNLGIVRNRKKVRNVEYIGINKFLFFLITLKGYFEDFICFV